MVETASKFREIEKVLNVITMQQGPGEVLVHVKVVFTPMLSIEEACHVINEFEHALRTARDEARWVYVVEGGDSGWRTGFQYATDPWAQDKIKEGQPLQIPKACTWMTEEIWKGAPAWVVPPVGFISRGPCGVTFYPGTGLPARYDGHFFLCDFPGGIQAAIEQACDARGIPSIGLWAQVPHYVPTVMPLMIPRLAPVEPCAWLMTVPA